MLTIDVMTTRIALKAETKYLA